MRISMAHQDPKQEIVNRLTRLLVSNISTQHDGSPAAKYKTLRFLKERSIDGRQVHIVVFENGQGNEMHFTCYVEQNAQGNWQFRGAVGDGIMGTNPGPVVERAWANLGGGGMPDHFYAGGFVADHGQGVTSVRLVAKCGTTIDDTVEDGMVLFLTRQTVDLPVEAELYDQDGTLVYKHTVLG
jgi:hypothetical protein